MQSPDTYGLIGYPLSHSFSPRYFTNKFKDQGIVNAVYKIFEIDDIVNLFNVLPIDIVGFNVTIPHKESIIPLLDELDEDAAEIGAVNTVIRLGKRFKGYNTDIHGFESALKDFLGISSVTKALVLGTGGASKAVKFVLKKLGIVYTSVSRKSTFLNYSELNEKIISDHQLIVNTTPLGTYPNIESYPDIPYHHLNKKHFLFDLVYNPEKSLFLNKGEQSGAKICNGYEMLVQQAEKSWKIWNQLK